MTVDDKQQPYWIAEDTKNRIMLNSADYGEASLIYAGFGPQTAAMKRDEGFGMPEVTGQALVWKAVPATRV